MPTPLWQCFFHRSYLFGPSQYRPHSEYTKMKAQALAVSDMKIFQVFL